MSTLRPAYAPVDAPSYPTPEDVHGLVPFSACSLPDDVSAEMAAWHDAHVVRMTDAELDALAAEDMAIRRSREFAGAFTVKLAPMTLDDARAKLAAVVPPHLDFGVTETVTRSGRYYGVSVWKDLAFGITLVAHRTMEPDLAAAVGWIIAAISTRPAA